MKKLVLRLLFGFVFLPLSLWGTLFYLNENGFFNVDKVEVMVLNTPAGQDQFLKPYVANLENNLEKYKGVSLWNIKLKEITGEIANQNWIYSLNLQRNWPSTLTLRLIPHEVKLLYVSKNSKLIPVIKQGELLDPVEARQAPDVAILEGEVFAKKPELRKKAVEVIDQIPAEGSFSKKTISEVHYDNNDGFWMTMIKTGTQVNLGSDQVLLKSARVSKVVDYLESRQFDARVIDANLSKKVLVRLRKDP